MIKLNVYSQEIIRNKGKADLCRTGSQKLRLNKKCKKLRFGFRLYNEGDRLTSSSMETEHLYFFLLKVHCILLKINAIHKIVAMKITILLQHSFKTSTANAKLHLLRLSQLAIKTS